MKYVDATTYKTISEEELRTRVEICKTMPQMVVYQGDLNVDLARCSDEHFFEVCCNVLVVH